MINRDEVFRAQAIAEGIDELLVNAAIIARAIPRNRQGEHLPEPIDQHPALSAVQLRPTNLLA